MTKAPFSKLPPVARIAVVGGMMSYFEGIMETNFRDTRRLHVENTIKQLDAQFDADFLGLWAEEKDSEELARKLTVGIYDVVLLVPTMATPPEALVDLALKANAPIVIASAHEPPGVGQNFDMKELCRHSIGVGATMLQSLLAKRANAQKAILINGNLNDDLFHKRLNMALRAAYAANRLSKLRLGRLGKPMAGYAHVDMSSNEAYRAGFELVDIELADWTDRTANVSRAAIDDFIQNELILQLPVGSNFNDSVDLRSAVRQALALDQLANDYDIDCGSINCRGPFGVELEDGAISCLATALLARSGRTNAATGDMLTGVAMWLGRQLGGAAVYCELDAFDPDQDAFLVANTGEADFAWHDEDPVSLHDASIHSGRRVPGVVIEQRLSPAPATMVGLAPSPNDTKPFSFCTIAGQTLHPKRTGLKVGHGWFRPANSSNQEVYEDWINTGVPHHGALAKGNLGEAVGWSCSLAGFSKTLL